MWLLRVFLPKGKKGELQVRRHLDRLLTSGEYHHFHDVLLPSRGVTTQVDHIVISRFGVFVIETKNMAGWIFGDPVSTNWTQVIFEKKSTFPNPLRQNYGHLKAVQSALGIEVWETYGIVAFVGSAEPKTPMPESVVWDVVELARHIRSHRSVLFTAPQVADLIDRLSSAQIASSGKARRQHIRHVKREVRNRRTDLENCPRCKAPLTMRKNKRTGSQFLGCSRYPACRGSRPVR